MLTFFIYALTIVVAGGVLFLIGAFAFGRGEEMAAAPADRSPVWLPSGRPIVAGDVHGLVLPVCVRGYRMSDVDWVLDRLAETIEEREHEIARLRGEEPAETVSPAAAEPGPADPQAELLGADAPPADPQAERGGGV